jgi:hypothetical protein
LYSVVLGFDSDGIDIETFGSRGFIANVDGGVEVQLSHNLLALGKFELGIFIVGVEFNTFLKVLDRIFGLEDSCIGNSAAEVGLRE